MSPKEGKSQKDAVGSEKPSESSLVDLLHGLQGRDKERGQASLRMSLSPVLIANILLSVVLLVTIYKIGVLGFGLQEKVEESRSRKHATCRNVEVYGGRSLLLQARRT